VAGALAIPEHPGKSWSTREHPGVPWSTLKHPGAPWKILEHPGAPGSTLEHPGAPGSTKGVAHFRVDCRAACAACGRVTLRGYPPHITWPYPKAPWARRLPSDRRRGGPAPPTPERTRQADRAGQCRTSARRMNRCSRLCSTRRDAIAVYLRRPSAHIRPQARDYERCGEPHVRSEPQAEPSRGARHGTAAAARAAFRPRPPSLRPLAVWCGRLPSGRTHLKWFARGEKRPEDMGGTPSVDAADVMSLSPNKRASSASSEA
jgi:hypothetical protein